MRYLSIMALYTLTNVKDLCLGFPNVDYCISKLKPTCMCT